MKFFAKKLCSITLALCVILSAMFVLPVSAATDNVITVGTPVTVTLSEGESCYLQFTPDESGEYIFYACNGNGLINQGHVVDSQNDPLASADSYSGIGENFCLLYEFTAGNTYTLRTSFSDGSYSGSYDVVIERNPVKSFTIEPVTLIENTAGFWNTYWDSELQKDVDYFNYYWQEKALATIEFTNGNTVGAYLWDSIEYNGYYFDLSFYDDQHGNPWAVDNTYTATASFMGKTLEVPVSIAESPIKSITAEPISIIECTNGGWSGYYDEGNWVPLYYDYSWYNKAKANIEFTDGSTISAYFNEEIQHNGQNYYFSCSDDQHRNNWTAGNTYTATASLLGKKVDIDVTITKSPVESITIEPINIIEGSNGYNTTYWDHENNQEVEFYYYNWYNKANATIKFTNGTTTTVSLNESVEYDDEYYSFSYNNTQYSNPWTVGNTYTVPVEILGQSTDVSVTITKSPIQSITVQPISIPAFTSGYWTWDYDDAGNRVDYYCYNWDNNATATIEFNDGTIIEEAYIGCDIEYKGEYYYLSDDDNQRQNPWTVGNTYTATVSCMGLTIEVPVTITEPPIKSISVKPLSIQEGTYGWWTWDFDDEGNQHDYYRYQWYDYIDVVVEFSDGTTGTYGLWDTITYGDSKFSIDWTNDTQHWYNPWTAGNTYTEQVSVGGVSTDVNVTITEAPYESIEILSVTPIKETNFSYINENGDKIYNLPQFTYKINFKDGSSLIRESNCYYEDHRISWSDSQYAEPWTVGGENLVTISLGKASSTFSVELIEVADWEYVEQNGGLFITNCGLAQSEITVPDEIDGKPVIGIINLGDCLNSVSIINLPDSVTYLSEEAFDGGHNLVSVNIGKNISELNPDAFAYCSVSEINVSEQNPHFSTLDGVVYNKSGDTLVVYPLGQGYTYYVPDNVVDANVMLEKDYYSYIQLVFSENSKAFKEVDGVTYNADMTIVISCDPEKTGSYNMPDSVTAIKEFAFSGSQLSSISVSDNVSEIVYNAFSYCNNLETIKLPDTLTSIGDSAFFESNLKNLKTLPDSLNNIDGNAFAGTSITDMEIPASVTEIGYNAFAYSMLETLKLNSGIESIDSAAFMGCKISTLTIPDSVTYMGGYAFAYNPITQLSIGKGLGAIPEGAFANCSLTSFTTPKNIEYIGSSAFANSPLSKVNFQADEIYIDSGAFSGCPLDRTIFSNNLKGFGSYAFAGNSMTSVKIPDAVTDITYFSFAYSENLADINIPDTLENIDGHAFDGTAWYEAQPDGVVYLENALYGYKGDIIDDTEIVVKNGTVVIADYAFDGGRHIVTDEIIHDFSGLKSVVLPDTLKTIGAYAFYYCTGLEKIAIPASVVNIEYGAFYACENLTIYGFEGSCAEIYANQHGIPFVTMVEKVTEEIKVTAPPEVIDENAQLVVEELVQENVIQQLPEEIEFTNIAAFDIFFELDGEVVQPNGTVTVEIDVPDEFTGKYCDVYHIADDGTAVSMNAVYKNGKLVFETTHFSVYAIIENKPPFTSGDVNDDGNIDNKDYAVLMQHLNGWDVEINNDAADVNGDGNVDNKDYAVLMQYLNDWDVTLGPKA